MIQLGQAPESRREKTRAAANLPATRGSKGAKHLSRAACCSPRSPSALDGQGLAPFATVVGSAGMATALSTVRAIFNPTPNSEQHGGRQRAGNADNGNAWIRKTQDVPRDQLHHKSRSA